MTEAEWLACTDPQKMLKSKARDFPVKRLAPVVAVDPRNQAILQAWQQHAGDRKTLVFAVDLNHVEQLRRTFEEAGVPVASVWGDMDLNHRRQVLADFREGRYQVLVGCEVLTEGYDEQSISAVVMARPTKSLGLYQQAVGRGLRLHPESGKSDLMVLDIQDRSTLHEVRSASHLFGADVPDCRGQDVRAVADEDRVYRQLHPVSPTKKQQARWASGDDTRWLEQPDLLRYQATGWPGVPATKKQLRELGRFGMKVHRPLTEREARYLIDECWRLDQKYPTPPTPDQQRYLISQGLWYPGMTKRRASMLIGVSKVA